MVEAPTEKKIGAGMAMVKGIVGHLNFDAEASGWTDHIWFHQHKWVLVKMKPQWWRCMKEKLIVNLTRFGEVKQI